MSEPPHSKRATKGISVLNLYARLMLRVLALVAAYLLVALTVGRSIVTELFVVGAIFIPIVIVMGLLAVRNVSQPMRRLIDASQRVMEGDYDVAVDVERSDEIGFLASQLRRIQAYLKRNRAVMHAVFEAAMRGSGSKEAEDDARRAIGIESLEVIELDAARRAEWQRSGVDPIDASDAPIRQRVGELLGRTLDDDEAAHTIALPVADSTGQVSEVAIVRAPFTGGLAVEDLRLVRAIVGAKVLRKEQERVRKALVEQEARARDERAVDDVLPSNVDGISVAGFEIAHRLRARGAQRTDWIAAVDGRAHGKPLVICVGDCLEEGTSAIIARTAIATALSSFSTSRAGIADVAQALDHALVSVGKKRLSCAAIFFALRDGDARVEWATCGLSLLHRHGDVVGEPPAQGPLLGDGGEPEVRSFDLAPGDAIAVFTDGVFEARGIDGSPFGRERVASALRAQSTATATATGAADALVGSFDAFVATKDPDADDASFLVVRKLP